MHRRAHILIRAAAVAGLAAAPAALAAAATAVGQQPPPAPAVTARVVHHFDFDERPENLEPLPMFWLPFRPTGFPRYAEATFDDSVGHDAPPSFVLRSNGRNVACRYAGAATRVRSRGAYRVTGFLRPAGLVRARAGLAACFMDDRMLPLPGTFVRTPLYGDADLGGEEWIPLDLRLPPPPPQALAVGLIVMVLQEQAWNTELRPRRFVEKVDLDATAWFDDITVLALPRIALETSSPSNVLPSDQPRYLSAQIQDFDGFGLTASVQVKNEEGRDVLHADVPVQTRPAAPPDRILLDGLQPGWYRAALAITLDGQPIESRTRTFVILPAPESRRPPLAASFGVVIGGRDGAPPAVEAELVRLSGVRAAKIPLWPGSPVSGAPSPDAAERHTAWRQLQRSGIALTAVFAGPSPEMIRAAGPYPRTLLEILSEAPAGWRDDLTTHVAPAADIFPRWQLGGDGDAAMAEDPRLETALEALRREMVPLLHDPTLAIPLTTNMAPAEAPISAEATLSIGEDVATEWITPHVRAAAVGQNRLNVHLPTQASRGAADPRLASWAQRLLTARHTTAPIVFVDQPWGVLHTEQGGVVEPAPEYAVLRTTAAMIGGRRPAGRIRIAELGWALVFTDGETSVIGAWDPAAPEEGTEVHIQLGRAHRGWDVWGRSFDLPRDAEGRHVLRVTRLPQFVDGIEPWVLSLRQSVRITPEQVTFSLAPQPHEFQMTHDGDRALTAKVELRPPPGWTVDPDELDVTLMPGQTLSRPIVLTYDASESAGPTTVRALIRADGGSAYTFDVPVPLELGLADIDVWAVAMIDGSNIVVRQVVTNRTETSLNLRGTAAVPQRPRQYQMISGLRPGETRAVEYRFAAHVALSGESARVGLIELGGSRYHNQEVTLP
ncbi:MAG: hypothetical protein C4547_02125 [Phycisphaerales bacterium]|nr:MAG: hypothetical protein C4547_02125 [Phycisphaerales bacterium]